MLLRHTPTESVERSALTINPSKTCQPIGAMYAALGINRCLPHSHGSQGCCSYHRSQLTRHTKEPIMAATSSFTEGSSVFGGQSNMLQAIGTIFSAYDPDVIAIHTTCLSETIGDDLTQITSKANDKGLIPEGKAVIHCSTPSYQGSHVTGYASMTKAMADSFATPPAEGAERSNTVNLIPGWVEAADVRELKRICAEMGMDIITFPDVSGNVDAPMSRDNSFYPEGGVTMAQLTASGSSKASIALGPMGAGPAARHLESTCKVPAEVLEVPYGIRATDAFVQHISQLTGQPVPATLMYERQRLVDLISDMQQYFYGKKVALWGDPDQIVPMAQFLCDLNMIPACTVTGSGGKAIEKRFAAATADGMGSGRFKCGSNADMFLVHQWIKQDGDIDLLIGNTHGKHMARDLDLPMVRHGFPILDRIGHQYFTTVGYRGAMRLCEQILTALMDRQDRDAPEESFELVM